MRHSALLYSDQEDLVAGVLPFLRDGAERGDALLVAMPRANVDAVREALGPGGPRVTYMDVDENGGNPARLLSSWQEFSAIDTEAGMSCVGESLWPGRGPAEVEECERHESMLNYAFSSSTRTTLLCPYDRELGEDVISRVGHSHRELSSGGEETQSESFVEPGDSSPFSGTLAEPDAAVTEVPFVQSQLSALRELLRERAEGAGLAGNRRDDLVLAGDELATNSIRHAGGGGTMRVWADDDAVFCEVSDNGRLTDPMAGRLRPPPDQIGGRGLWLANQLCDLVQIRSGDEGTVVRLSMRLPGA